MPRALSGATKALQTPEIWVLSLFLSVYLSLSHTHTPREKLSPRKYCLMTCLGPVGRSARHPACHIFAAMMNGGSRGCTRPGPGRRLLPSEQPPPSQSPEVPSGLQAGGWVSVASRALQLWPCSDSWLLLGVPAIWSSLAPGPHCPVAPSRVSVLLNCPYFWDLCPSH